MNPNYEYKAKVLNIVDGDTIDVLIDLGFDISFKDRIRLDGIDTPELTSKDEAIRAEANKAKQFLVDNILGKEVILRTYKPDKYGRYLAHVFLNGFSINNKLLDEGLAEVYYGGTKA